MIIKHVEKQNIGLKWYDFYKILNYHFLKTYRLIPSNNEVLKNLFNDNRFVKTNIINDDVEFRFLSIKHVKFRKQNKIVESFTSKIQEILDNEEFLSSTYDELITMTKSK